MKILEDQNQAIKQPFWGNFSRINTFYKLLWQIIMFMFRIIRLLNLRTTSEENRSSSLLKRLNFGLVEMCHIALSYNLAFSFGVKQF